MDLALNSGFVASFIRAQEGLERYQESLLQEMPKIIEMQEQAARYLAKAMPALQRAAEHMAETVSSPMFQRAVEQHASYVASICDSITIHENPTIVCEEIEVLAAESALQEGIPCLPENAELIDKNIALEVRENEVWLHFYVQSGWVRERIRPQTHRIIQFLRDQARYPDNRRFRLTDLCKGLTDAISSDVKRSSIANRLRELREICTKHGAKPIIAKEAKRYRYNPLLEP